MLERQADAKSCTRAGTARPEPPPKMKGCRHYRGAENAPHRQPRMIHLDRDAARVAPISASRARTRRYTAKKWLLFHRSIFACFGLAHDREQRPEGLRDTGVQRVFRIPDIGVALAVLSHQSSEVLGR